MSVNQLDIIDEKVKQSVILTLNKPSYSHAITINMASSMLSKLLVYEEQSNTSMVIIKEQGDKTLAVGETDSVYDDIQDQIALRNFHQAIDDIYRVTYELSTMKTPTIAIMDGQTIGFSSGIAFCSKIRIATENTIMMMPEITLGHFMGSSTSYFLSRLKNNYGRYLALCAAAPTTVEDIMTAGIATHYVPSSKIPSMIEHLTHLRSPSLKEINAAINLFTERWPIDSLSCTMDVSKDRMMQKTIKECFRFNTIEEILVALKNEGSAFSSKTRNDMLKASPTAMKITLELLCQASNLSFIDCIILERRLWSLDVLSHDFKEGHKSIINRTAPRWYPKSLHDVDLERDIKRDWFHAANALKPMYLRHIEHATFQDNVHFDDFGVAGSEYEVIYKCSL